MPLNEGQTVQYTVITTRVADGTVLYWKTTGNTTNSDIVGGNTGSVTITNNQGVFNVTPTLDVSLDGTKTLGIALSTGSISGPTVGQTTSLITVEDTSVPPTSKLYVWGINGSGILGLSDTTYRSSPTQLGTGINWSTISTRGLSTLATKTDGTLWAWGRPGYTVLGTNDSGVYRSSPVQVGADTNWSKVSQSGSHAMAIKTNGTLWAWGKNDYGQLGLNSVNTPVYRGRSSPVQIGTDNNWSSVSTSEDITAAIKTNGTLWTWGRAQPGSSSNVPMLGRPNATNTNTSSPVQVGTDTNWSKVDIGIGVAMAIKTNGTLWTWGAGRALGLNLNYVYRSEPSQLGSLTTWSDAAVNRQSRFSAFSVALRTDGTLWSWGAGTEGPLGLNNSANRSSPVQIAGTNWASIATDDLRAAAAIKTDGTLWTWGDNFNGNLGLNDRTYRSSPVQVGTRTNWSLVSMGERRIMAFTNS
jgi:alpha-tubulin suppressor-like RCC1 family protein